MYTTFGLTKAWLIANPQENKCGTNQVLFILAHSLNYNYKLPLELFKGWDECVAYTVPLIRKMESKIMSPLAISPMK